MKPSVRVPVWFVVLMLVGCGPASEPEVTSTGEEAAIQAVLVEAYVQGIHVNRDVAAVRGGFHPDFVMTVYDEGQVIQAPLQMWLDLLQLDGEPTSHTIDYAFSSIDVTGNTATAKMEIFQDGTHIYTDYFGLYKFPDGWRIVNKIFYGHD